MTLAKRNQMYQLCESAEMTLTVLGKDNKNGRAQQLVQLCTSSVPLPLVNTAMFMQSLFTMHTQQHQFSSCFCSVVFVTSSLPVSLLICLISFSYLLITPFPSFLNISQW